MAGAHPRRAVWASVPVRAGLPTSPAERGPGRGAPGQHPPFGEGAGRPGPRDNLRSGDSNVCAALSFNFSWNMGMEGEAPPNPLFFEIDTREQNLQVLHKNNTLAKFLQCRFGFLCRHPGPDKNKPVFGMPVAPKLF